MNIKNFIHEEVSYRLLSSNHYFNVVDKDRYIDFLVCLDLMVLQRGYGINLHLNEQALCDDQKSHTV